MAILLGAQLYSLRAFTQTPAEYEATLGKVAGMGYTSVQLSGAGAIDPHELKDHLQKHGLVAPATHINFDLMLEDLDGVIQNHKVLGVDYPGVGGMPPRYRTGKEGIEAFIRDANGVAKKLADAGLTFIYHNHAWEYTRLDGRLIMDILLENTVPEFQFELDVYWAQAGGVNPVEWVKKLNGRIDVIHYKDMALTLEGAQRFAPIGSGNLDFPAIIGASRGAGVKHAFVEQDDSYEDCPFDCMKRSYDYLSGRL